MPAQKRSREASPLPTAEDEEEKSGDLHLDNQNQKDEEGENSDESSASEAEKDEFITLRLSEIRKDVQCPICLGIIRKTRTVMECLHRFCRECIDKSMRMGNNECPACRTHCASRRSLRDDPNYDALIAILYPDIDKYEEEELAFHEEEMTRNKQIQASIAQTLRRQTEALGKKRTTPRLTQAAYMRRSGNRNLRRRRNPRVEPQGSDDDEDANAHDDKDSSSANERGTESRQKRAKRMGGRFSQGSMAGNANAGCDENGSEMNRESLGATGLIGSSEILAWGKGGIRSQKTQNRYSSLGGGNARLCRISKLAESLQHSNENDVKVDIGLVHVSLCVDDEEGEGCFSKKLTEEGVKKSKTNHLEGVGETYKDEGNLLAELLDEMTPEPVDIPLEQPELIPTEQAVATQALPQQEPEYSSHSSSTLISSLISKPDSDPPTPEFNQQEAQSVPKITAQMPEFISRGTPEPERVQIIGNVKELTKEQLKCQSQVGEANKNIFKQREEIINCQGDNQQIMFNAIKEQREFQHSTEATMTELTSSILNIQSSVLYQETSIQKLQKTVELMQKTNKEDTRRLNKIQLSISNNQTELSKQSEQFTQEILKTIHNLRTKLASEFANLHLLFGDDAKKGQDKQVRANRHGKLELRRKRKIRT